METALVKERIARYECPMCGKPQLEWTHHRHCRCCSPKCTEEYNKENGMKTWQSFRQKALDRNGWRCVKCGVQPTIECHNRSVWDKVLKEVPGEKEWERTYTLVSTLVVDHILPIALGGEEWDLDNLQTLCLGCNKVKTALDAKKIAEARRSGKVKDNGQITLDQLENCKGS